MFLDGLFVLLIVFPALHYFRMKKQVVRHDDCSQYTHDDEHTSLRNVRRNPRTGSQSPVDIDQKEFVEERKADHRNEGDDAPLNAFVRIGEKQYQHKDRRQYGSNDNRYAEQHFQCNGSSQYFRQRRRDTCQHGTTQDGTRYPLRRIFVGSLAQTQAGYDT